MLQCKYYNRGWHNSLIHKQLSDKNRPNHNTCTHTLSIALVFLQAVQETIFSYRTISALLHWHQESNSHSSQSKCAVRKRIKTRNWLKSEQSPPPSKPTYTDKAHRFGLLPFFHLQKCSFTDFTSPVSSFETNNVKICQRTGVNRIPFSAGRRCRSKWGAMCHDSK